MSLIPASVGELVIVRHGQSAANADNSFAGWENTPLSDIGVEQAEEAGVSLRKAGFKPDIVYSSPLDRAHHSAKFILAGMGMPKKEIRSFSALMERHYGALTGLNKDDARERYGKDAVETMRRSYDAPLIPMDETHPYHPNNPAPGPKVIGIPLNGKGHETLKDVMERVNAFYRQEILPRMQNREKVLIVAHGTSLRALSMILENLTPDQIQQMSPTDYKKYEIPNASPIRYHITSEKGSDCWTAQKHDTISPQLGRKL